jgi:hypothetical protein
MKTAATALSAVLPPRASSSAAISASTNGVFSTKLECARMRAISFSLPPSPMEIFSEVRTMPQRTESQMLMSAAAAAAQSVVGKIILRHSPL